jgi:N-glycosylase/DNA lyase
VARPIGIVPMNIDTVLWPKMRRASWPNIIQRAE